MPGCEDSSNDNRNVFWSILEYEVLMMHRTSNLINDSKCKTISKENVIQLALRESSLLHRRVLVDFFLEKTTSKGSISPNDLGIDTENENFKSNKKALEIAYDKKIEIENGKKIKIGIILSKMLAHPDRFRTDEYNYNEICSILEQPLKNMINCVFEIAGRVKPYPDNWIIQSNTQGTCTTAYTHICHGNTKLEEKNNSGHPFG